MALLAAILASTQNQADFDAPFRRAAHLAFIISERRFLPAGVSLLRRRRTCALPRLVELLLGVYSASSAQPSVSSSSETDGVCQRV